MDRAREGNRDVNDCSYRTHTHTPTHTHKERQKSTFTLYIWGSFIPSLN